MLELINILAEASMKAVACIIADKGLTVDSDALRVALQAEVQTDFE